MQVGHIARGIGKLVIGEQHRRPIGTAVVGGRLDTEVSFQTLVEIVAGFGAGGEQTGSGERAVDFFGDQSALHPEPEEVELRIVGDDARFLEDRLEWSQVIAGGAKVDGPDGSTVAAQGEEANVALPWVEAVGLSGSVGLDVQCDSLGILQVEGDPIEVAALGAEDGLRGIRDVRGISPLTYIQTI